MNTANIIRVARNPVMKLPRAKAPGTDYSWIVPASVVSGGIAVAGMMWAMLRRRKTPEPATAPISAFGVLMVIEQTIIFERHGGGRDLPEGHKLASAGSISARS